MENKNILTQLTRTPERGLWSIHEAIDRMFGDFFRGFELEPSKWEAGFNLPTVDVAETEREINVKADLPGMRKEDIELTFNKDHDCLILKGERKEEKEEKKKDYYRKERRFGSVYREIPLPCEVIPEKASAEFKNGELNITVPKSTQALKEAHKVPIKGD